MKLKIFVSHHKDWYIFHDNSFIPIHVWKKNSKKNLWILWDDTWNSISIKNSSYAELTAQYWVWKNYDLTNIEYIWYCHYRRYFTTKFNFLNFIINNRDYLNSFWDFNTFYSNFSKTFLQKNNNSFISSLEKDFDVCLPKKARLWLFTTIKNHYSRHHLPVFRSLMRDVVVEIYPEYQQSFLDTEKSKSMYTCNMFIMKKKFFYEYNEWLFTILFELEKRIKELNIKIPSAQSRIYGFLWERLLNVWLSHKNRQNNINYIYSNFLFLK